MGSGLAARAGVVLGQPLLHETGRAWLAQRYKLIEVDDLSRIDNLIGQADALYCHPPLAVTPELIARGRNLKVIAAAGSGVDHIAVVAALAHGVVVTHAVGAGALSVAEHAIGQMLALAKRLVACDRAVREGNFAFRQDGSFQEISGRTLAIVGYGAIGQELARIGRLGFRMRIVAVTRDGSAPADPNVDAVMPLQAALREADIVSIHTPLTPSTTGLIGADALACMKPTAWLVNTSRGGVVDAAALFDALRSGRIAAAALDVFDTEPPAPDHPLLQLPNVVVSPHCAGITAQAYERLSMAAARDIDAVLRGQRPENMIEPAGWPRSRAAALSPNSHTTSIPSPRRI
jgi:D-3-phosphoglycerate dehydrogenase